MIKDEVKELKTRVRRVLTKNAARFYKGTYTQRNQIKLWLDGSNSMTDKTMIRIEEYLNK